MLIRSKSLISKVAQEMNLPEELVEDVVNYYYRRVRKKVEGLEADRIRITGLGVLHIRKKKLEKSIEKLTAYMNSDKDRSFKFLVKRKKMESALDEQIKFLTKLNSNEYI